MHRALESDQESGHTPSRQVALISMAHINYNADNPGPGAYYLNYKQVLLEAPKPSFGLRTELWADKARPGPGTYNVRNDGNISPKFTIAKQYDGPSGTKTPSPGTYYASLKQTNVQVPIYTIQGKYNYFPDGGIPGPGTYNVRQEQAHNVGYTLGKKFSPHLSTTPGFGHYSPQTRSGSPSYTIGQHLVDVRPNTPGVGTYNLRSATLDGPMFSMGKRFYSLRQQKEGRRYSRALKSRPNYRKGQTYDLLATNSRGGTHALIHFKRLSICLLVS